MKKIILFLSSLCLVFVLNSTNVQAQKNAILSETVKIVAYNLTNNNHVIEKSLASGTLISSDGLVLTNYHVVVDEDNEPYETFTICIVTDTQTKPDCLYTANLIAQDKSLDSAILQINPLDVYEKAIPNFPYLSYQNNILPEIGEKIEITGFPGIGGQTITATKGQLSGYDEKENITQLKTDATISAGNSGGTAKNSAGIFIGIPSYLKSNISSIGYIIPLTEIAPWIEINLDAVIQSNTFATNLLQSLLLQKEETEQNNKFTSKLFPYYQIDIPESWEIDFLNDTNLILTNIVKGFSIYLEFNIEVIPYEIKDDFIDYLFKKIEKYYHLYTNYKRQDVSFYGIDGILISYDYSSYRNYYFIAPIKNVLFSYNYQVSLDDLKANQKAISEILDSLIFLQKENNSFYQLQKYSQQHPAISISTSKDFFIAPIYDSQNEEEILNIYNPNSYEQSFVVSQNRLPRDYWNLSVTDILNNEIKNAKYRNASFQLLNKYENVVIDGLTGFAYSYSYQGEDYNQIRKQINATILVDKKYFRFVYDDLNENFEKNIGKVIAALKTFKYDGEENKKTKNTYSIPSFKMHYQDLIHYPYAKQINALVDKEILNFSSKYFYPEKPITRIDVLEAILNSKIFVEEGRNLTKTKDSIQSITINPIFADQNISTYNKILNYSLEKNIIKSNANFFPTRGITLAETLKILCQTYELPTWNPPYLTRIKWYVPYIFKGIELDIIPYQTKFDTTLSRGQFAVLLYDFLEIIGERDDL